MELAGRRISLEIQIGVHHPLVYLSGERNTEKLRKAEIFPPNSPFVIERRFARSNNAAAALDEVLQLLALRLRQGRDIGQNQRPKRFQVLLIEELVVNHLEWDSAFYHGVLEAELRIFYLGASLFAAIEGSGLLGIDQADARKRLLIPQILLVRVMPLI